MNMHLRFAANLRRECYRYDSIADVCRGIGINRQQFNRYLSGKAIPNATTMQRVCKFFGIVEDSLFHTEALSSEPLPPSNIPPKPGSSCQTDKAVAALLEQLRTSDRGSLAQGWYFVYYPMPGVANLLMRSLMIIREGGSFTRVTVFPRDGRAFSYLFKGRHDGIVYSNGSQTYLLGLTRGTQSRPQQMTLLALESRSNSADQRFLCGLSLIRTTTEFISTAVCIEKLPRSQHLKDAYRLLGPVNSDDLSVDKFVVAALGGFSGAQLLRSVEYHTILSQNRASARSQLPPIAVSH